MEAPDAVVLSAVGPTGRGWVAISYGVATRGRESGLSSAPRRMPRKRGGRARMWLSSVFVVAVVDRGADSCVFAGVI